MRWRQTIYHIQIQSNCYILKKFRVRWGNSVGIAPHPHPYSRLALPSPGLPSGTSLCHLCSLRIKVMGATASLTDSVTPRTRDSDTHLSMVQPLQCPGHGPRMDSEIRIHPLAPPLPTLAGTFFPPSPLVSALCKEEKETEK